MSLYIVLYFKCSRVNYTYLKQFDTTGFPPYMKVEHFYENFSKLKCYKTKKQLSLTYMEKILHCPTPPQITYYEITYTI